MYNSKNTAAKVAAQEKYARDKFISIHSGSTWTEYEDRYAVVDLSGATTTSDGIVKNKFIETKGRNIPSNEYGTTFLELKKLDNMLDFAEINDGKAFYFVTYTDGKSYLFDLTHVKEKYAIQQQWMNDVTIGDYTTQKVLKDVIHLPLFAANKKYK
ncbi:hypothetical protein [Pedobacter nyackensis]|uniref:hypothetical protein n=1 Tax=Pedobacter nyackensis TaxID=475255 RepID=UPI00292FC0A4|nr:hypothetical protein [Pedobacter nyackensis]